MTTLLWNVSPVSAIGYMGYLRWINAIHYSDVFLQPASTSTKIADIFHVTFRKLSCNTTLFSHIPHIVFVWSQKKMGWIYTRWIITCMKAIKTIWYWAVVQFIRIAMGHCPALLSINIESTVPSIVKSASPNPTTIIISFICFRPKTFFWCSFWLSPSFLSASATIAAEAILVTSVFRKAIFGIKVLLVATRACFHDVVSYCSYLISGCGQAVGLAIRNGDQPSLAHLSNYITNRIQSYV